jgi:peptidoglycan/xylan/chitin deacetylase (PgdA/CDA1 family)
LEALTLLFFSHMLILYPTLRPGSSWWGPVVTRFRTSRQEVWLTIDDGPTDDTAEIVQLLEAEGGVATFFVKGILAARQPEMIELMKAAGNTIANHSATHPSATFWCLTPDRLAEEIDRANEAIVGTGSERPRWFRAPVGMKNPWVHPLLEARGMRLIAWSRRAFDAVRSDPEAIARKLTRGVRAGDILLVHQGRPASIAALRAILGSLRLQGFRLVIPDDASLM